MNTELDSFARNKIIERLNQLPEAWVTRFKQMYANGDLSLSIVEVVALMPSNKLDWAMIQIDNSLKKIKT